MSDFPRCCSDLAILHFGGRFGDCDLLVSMSRLLTVCHVCWSICHVCWSVCHVCWTVCHVCWSVCHVCWSVCHVCWSVCHVCWTVCHFCWTVCHISWSVCYICWSVCHVCWTVCHVCWTVCHVCWSVYHVVTSVGQYITSVGQYVTSVGQYVTSVGQYVTSVRQYATSVGEYVTSVGQCVASHSQLSMSPCKHDTFFHLHLHLPLNRGGRLCTQMTSQPLSSVFLCSPLPSRLGELRAGSFPDVVFAPLFSVCLVFFSLSPCLTKWFGPDLMNGRFCSHHFSLRLFTTVRRSSCCPTGFWTLAQTFS